MNEGRYPDHVVNDAIQKLNQGINSRDVADELREKFGYERLHWKTLKRWHEKYPMGKVTDSGLKEVLTRIQRNCAAGEHDYKLKHYTTPGAQLIWRNMCQFCDQEEVLDIPTGTYLATGARIGDERENAQEPDRHPI